mmetsp:Transcript_5301/g.9181  ORF Transcript_5301/g.9181 Transcript_5301/m.9181 type:complete len:249 (-) Transcript_5301:651-1397(-)
MGSFAWSDMPEVELGELSVLLFLLRLRTALSKRPDEPDKVGSVAWSLSSTPDISIRSSITSETSRRLLSVALFMLFLMFLNLAQTCGRMGTREYNLPFFEFFSRSSVSSSSFLSSFVSTRSCLTTTLVESFAAMHCCLERSPIPLAAAGLDVGRISGFGFPTEPAYPGNLSMVPYMSIITSDAPPGPDLSQELSGLLRGSRESPTVGKGGGSVTVELNGGSIAGESTRREMLRRSSWELEWLLKEFRR